MKNLRADDENSLKSKPELELQYGGGSFSEIASSGLSRGLRSHHSLMCKQTSTFVNECLHETQNRKYICDSMVAILKIDKTS